MRLFLLTISMVLLQGISLRAVELNQTSACKDLAQFSCDSKIYSDSTGSSHPKADLYNKFLNLKKNWEKTHLDEVVVKLNSDKELRKNIFDSIDASGFDTCRYYFSSACAQIAATQFYKIISMVDGDPLSEDMTHEFFQHGTRDAVNGEGRVVTNPIFISEQKSFEEYLSNWLNASQNRKKIVTDIYPKTKTLLISLMDQLIPSGPEKVQMLTRLKALEMSSDDCKDQPTTIENLLEINAAYTPSDHLFRICNGYLLTTTSEFTIVHTIAHELTHSIDPCRIGMNVGSDRHLTMNPIVNFSASDDGDIETTIGKYPLSKELSCLNETNHLLPGDSNLFFALGKALNPNVKLPGYFCQHNHQANEAFPDLIASEVLAKYMALYHRDLKQEDYVAGFTNTFKGLCDSSRIKGVDEARSYAKKVNSAEDTHPDMVLRINQILLSNKKIRGEMGCIPVENPNWKDCLESVLRQ